MLKAVIVGVATCVITLAPAHVSAVPTTIVDVATVYDITCERADECAQQLVVVDGQDGPTILTFVDPAINAINEGRLSPDIFTAPSAGERRAVPVIAATEQSVVQIQGGRIDYSNPPVGGPAVFANDRSMVHITGGSVGGPANGIEAVGSARIVIEGGNVRSGNEFDFDPGGALVLGENATGEITGGEFNGRGYSISTVGNSQLTIRGGTIRGTRFTDDNSVVDVYGGTLFPDFDHIRPHFNLFGQSRVNIHGGIFHFRGPNERTPWLRTNDESVVHIYGTDLQSDRGLITGTFSDGTPIDLAVGGTSNVVLHEIPEPSSGLLAMLGLVLVASRVRTRFRR